MYNFVCFASLIMKLNTILLYRKQHTSKTKIGAIRKTQKYANTFLGLGKCTTNRLWVCTFLFPLLIKKLLQYITKIENSTNAKGSKRHFYKIAIKHQVLMNHISILEFFGKHF